MSYGSLWLVSYNSTSTTVEKSSGHGTHCDISVDESKSYSKCTDILKYFKISIFTITAF